MKNLLPAFSRIARIEVQQQRLWNAREAEFARIRKEGTRVAAKAIKQAKLVRGESLISIGRWVRGIYEGTELNWPPSGPGKEWSFRIHYRSILKSGKPGRKIDSHAVFVEHPGDVVRDVVIVGKVATP